MARFDRSKDEIRICNRCGKPCRIIWTRQGNKAVQTVGAYFAPDPTAYTTYISLTGEKKHGTKCSKETARSEYGYELHTGKNCINPNFMNE